jgi:EpsD family peptidyl-prolyl cis-trans isomerase
MRLEAVMRKWPSCLTMLAAVLLTAGCNESPPDGQVIAVVNGAEITIAELNEEARARNIYGASEPAVRAALLQDLIDRKLLVQEAIQAKLDRSPQYLIARERMKDVLLAQQLLASVGTGADAISKAELEKFIAANPSAFSGRTVLVVDQITFPRPSDKALIQKIEAAESLGAIEGLLIGATLPKERLVKTWDSAVLPEGLIGPLLRSEPGKPFVLPHGDTLIAGQVLSSTAQPIDPAQRLRLAHDRLTSERRDMQMRQKLASFRDEAEISYQAGFAPASQ